MHEAEELSVNVPFIVDQPLRFELHPDTQQLTVLVDASGARLLPGGMTAQVDLTATLLLTAETARALLRDLPELERLLLQATKARTRQDFVQ
jgi:hypothetical protein